jgi:hypothetical protein
MGASRIFLSIFLLVAIQSLALAATRTALSTGLWFNTATWSGNVIPGCGDIVVIPLGITVTVTGQDLFIDENSSPNCNEPTNVFVLGTLLMESRTLKMACGSGFSISPGGCINHEGPGSGSASKIEICTVMYWRTLDGALCAPLNSVIFGNPTTLPIEIQSFEAINGNNTIHIKWVLSSEKNNDYFILEHSLDGIDWSQLARIQSVGNHSTGQSYSFTDTEASFNKKNYYRLSQVDINGKKLTIGIDQAKIRSSLPGNTFLLIPNPKVNSGSLVAYIDGKIDESPIMYCYDQSGRLMKVQQLNIRKGMNRINLELKNLPPGYYFVTITMRNGVLKNNLIVH